MPPDELLELEDAVVAVEVVPPVSGM